MTKQLQRISFLFITIISASLMFTGCKAKVNDTDLQTSASNTLRNNPAYSGVTVSVQDGVATLSGQVPDEANRSGAESEVKSVKGVKSVNNNITVAAAVAPIEVTPDDPLNTSVRDAIKDHPGVNASVNDGVITVTGTIKKADLPKLMQKLNSLKPRKIENQLVVN